MDQFTLVHCTVIGLSVRLMRPNRQKSLLVYLRLLRFDKLRYSLYVSLCHKLDLIKKRISILCLSLIILKAQDWPLLSSIFHLLSSKGSVDHNLSIHVQHSCLGDIFRCQTLVRYASSKVFKQSCKLFLTILLRWS